MSVVIEELQVETSAPRPPAPAPEASASAAAFDERPVRELFEREAARLARLHTD